MKKHSPLRGVNLGGWLVAEKWMTPSLFAGTTAVDQYSLVRTFGGAARLQAHYETFITESDFIWLRSHGINAVRVPIGFWALTDEPLLANVQKQLDWLFDMAQKYEIAVLLCLHAARGSQNGNDHSGRVGKVDWYKPRKRAAALQVLSRVAERYGDHPKLWGIELLNEPKVKGFRQYLRLLWWSRRAVRQMGRQFPALRIAYSDAFAPRTWVGKVKGVMDVHHYQAFSDTDKRRNIADHLQKVKGVAGDIIQWQKKQPVIIGEWSLGLDDLSLKSVPRAEAEKQFGAAQLQAYDNASGWFFWSYKTEQKDGWNYRYLVESGILPNVPEQLASQ
jgi:glucan 1,3-beta-glucosidase